jgi:hypothetical protein
VRLLLTVTGFDLAFADCLVIHINFSALRATLLALGESLPKIGRILTLHSLEGLLGGDAVIIGV